MTAPAAILLQTHVFDRRVARLHRALRRACRSGDQVWLLIHQPPGSPRPRGIEGLPAHVVDTDAIRLPGYTGKSGGAGWSLWNGGHTDLIALHFARAHPGFAHYWVVEYDVRFTGGWSVLFDHFRDNEADLLATSVRTEAEAPAWHWWDTLRTPDGERRGLPETRLCAFLPIFRFSSRAAREMDRRYREGWTGHCEATWPTLLRDAGLVVEDLGGDGAFVRPGNRGRFYSNNPDSHTMGPGTLVFRPSRFAAGLRRDTLYHPVKPLNAVLKERGARAGHIGRRLLEIAAGRGERRSRAV